MSVELFPVNGAKLYIGGPTSAKAADHVEADFDGVTWVEIDGWQSCGALNDDTQTITTSLINRPRDSNSKGTKNAAPTEMIFAVLPEDPGQEDLYEADASRFNYNFRIVWDDAPAAVGSTPSESLFIALVGSVGERGGEANTTRMLGASLQRNSNIVPVAAVEGGA